MRRSPGREAARPPGRGGGNLENRILRDESNREMPARRAQPTEGPGEPAKTKIERGSDAALFKRRV